MKNWIYNELNDIPEEFVIIEHTETSSMFDDLQQILIRKKWIDEEKIEKSNITDETDKTEIKIKE